MALPGEKQESSAASPAKAVSSKVSPWSGQVNKNPLVTVPFALWNAGTTLWGVKATYEVFPRIYGYNIWLCMSYLVGGMDHVKDAMTGIFGYDENDKSIQENPLFYLVNEKTKSQPLAMLIKSTLIATPLIMRMFHLAYEFAVCEPTQNKSGLVPDWLRYVAIATVPFNLYRIPIEEFQMLRGSSEWIFSHYFFHFAHHCVFLGLAYQFPVFAQWDTVLSPK